MNAKPAAIVRLTTMDLEQLIKPPEGTHIASLQANWERATVDIRLEGPGLPLCEQGHIPDELKVVCLPKWGDGHEFMGLVMHREWVPDETAK